MPMIQVNGLEVEYPQAGAGPDLLLLHSLLTEMSVFEQVLPALARVPPRDLHQSCPASAHRARPRPGCVADRADHVARVMDALSLPATTDVFGNGFGAFVALELAIRHGARLGRLMVADTVAAFPEPARVPFRGMAEKVRASGMQAMLDTAIGRMFPPAFQAAHPDVVARAQGGARGRWTPQCFARACLALAPLDLRPPLGGIRNPTLVMCGALDQTTPPALAQDRCARHSRRALPRDRGLGPLPDARAAGGAGGGGERFSRGEESAIHDTINGRLARHTPRVRHGGLLATKMAENFKLRVNGREHTVSAEPNTPLLYILRNDLKLKGTRFGCGEGHCGACTVLIDGKRGAVVRHAAVVGAGPRDHHDRGPRRAIGRPAPAAAGVHRRAGDAVRLLHQRHHHVGRGAARRASRTRATPTSPPALDRNLCRCGTHVRILRAIQRGRARAAGGAAR